MIQLNKHYANLRESYLFAETAQRRDAYRRAHPDQKLLLLGVGDVTQPLCEKVTTALHMAVDKQAKKETFHGYMPECGADNFKEAITAYYAQRGVYLEKDEVFPSSGASDTLGDILDLFSADNTALIPEPTYPAYVDANIMAGHRIVHLPTTAETGFVPQPDESIQADIVYLCSPNNPTGAVYDRAILTKWVNYALSKQAVIIFDAAYEAFIEEDHVPHSIYEIEGACRCAVEICSLSKTAGFTGMRCGYTIVPKSLVFDGVSLNKMWVRNRTTKTNGVSYLLQEAGVAALSAEGQRQFKETLMIYKNNAKVIMKALDECRIRYCGGKNAPYIWMECPQGMDSWAFFDYLLNQVQIVGTPGEGFGSCGKHYFRLSSFGDPADTVLAGERLKVLFEASGRQ